MRRFKYAHMRRIRAAAVAALTSMLMASAAIAQTVTAPYEFTDADRDTLIPATATVITLDGSNASIEGSNAKLEGDTLRITNDGAYVLTGSSSNIKVSIETDKNTTVKLILRDAQLSVTGASAICAIKTGRLHIILEDGTTNMISGGSAIVDSDDADETLFPAIYAKNSMIITGGGSLVIESEGYGLLAKDSLIITGGNINVNSKDDAMRGSDSVAIENASISITSGADGIKSTKNEEGKGYVQIASSNITINAVSDGLQAETMLYTLSGTYNITTGGGYTNAAAKASGGFGMGQGFGRTGKGGRTATVAATPVPETVEYDADLTGSDSAKGMKAGQELIVAGGDITINSSDDAIHSNANVSVLGGDLTIASGDDGIHADSTLTIANGRINVTNAYEGIEGAAIGIQGGDITVVASDDAINVADGTASDRGMGFGFSTGSALTITIEGGVIHATGGKDCLDANGDIVMLGGELYLNGPSQGQDGAIDLDRTFTVQGGSIITAGSVSAPGSSSTQPTLIVYYSNTVASGSTIELLSSSGEVILSHVSSTSCSVSGFTSPNLRKGDVVTLVVNGQTLGKLQLSGDSYVTALTDTGAPASMNAMQGGKGGGRNMLPPQ